MKLTFENYWGEHEESHSSLELNGLIFNTGKYIIYLIIYI